MIHLAHRLTRSSGKLASSSHSLIMVSMGVSPAVSPPATDCDVSSVSGHPGQERAHIVKPARPAIRRSAGARSERAHKITHLAFVALRLGTQIFISSPSPSYARRERRVTTPANSPVMWTPKVGKPNNAHAARSRVKAMLDRGLELEEGW